MRTLIVIAFALSCCSCTTLQGTGWQTSPRLTDGSQAFLARSAGHLEPDRGADRDAPGQKGPRPILNVFPLEWHEGFLNSAAGPSNPNGASGRDPLPQIPTLISPSALQPFM